MSRSINDSAAAFLIFTCRKVWDMRRMDLQFSRKLACSLIKNIILSNYQIIILDKMRFIEYN